MGSSAQWYCALVGNNPMMKVQDVTDTQTQPFIVKDYALTRLGTDNLKMPDSGRQPEREERFHNYIRVS